MSDLPHLRIFVSSPGDVDTERKLTARVIERLQGEFRGRITLEAYFWEDEPMHHHRTFQEQIPATAEFDLVLCILWSRLGTPLTGPDGKQYPSGTDYEVESARAAYEATGKPDLMIYLNQTPAQLRQSPREERERMVRQLEALEDFVERHCFDRASGVLKGAFATYRDLGQFEDLLEKHLRKLVLNRLPARDAAGAVTAAPRAELTWHGRPYQGLRAFDFEHAPIFFGRTRATGEVLALLRQRALRLEEARAAAISGLKEGVDPGAATFVLVCAMSGVGKSSLVRAGVLPLLTQPGSGIGLWRRMVLRPSETPADGDLFDALAQELTKPNGLPELLSGGVSARELAFMLRQNPQGIELLLKQALSQAAETARQSESARLAEEERRCREAGRTHDVERLAAKRAALVAAPARLTVVIDQMEELFTLDGITPELRGRFVAALAALARSGWVWVIGTLRSDFFARCAETPELMDLQQNSIYHLKPPTPEELGQMIRRPAQAAALRFERNPTTDAALDESLRDAAMRSPEVLPLLEFALDQLYEKGKESRDLTWAAYKEIGGLEGALATAAEDALKALKLWEQETFDHVMSGLVTLGTGSAREETATRRTADYEVLTKPPGAKAFVDSFIAARLFVADQDTAGRAIVGVAHEALLGRKGIAASSDTTGAAGEIPRAGKPAKPDWLWRRFGEWIEANADFLRLRARVAVSLRQWQETEQDASFLLPTGRALLDGEKLLREHPQALYTEEQTYILRSVAAEADRQRRSVRGRTAITTTLALLAFGASVGAWFGYSGEHKAQAQTSIATEETKKAEAETAKSKTQIRQACLSDIATARDLLGKGDWSEAITYLRRAQTYDDDDNRRASMWLSSAIIYGVGDRDSLPQFLLSHENTVSSAAYSPDGTRIVTACGKTARQWEAATGKPLGEPLRHENFVYSAAYSPNGTRIVTASEDKTARQWEAATGKPLSEPLRHESDVYSAAYSPDGTRIVTACNDHTARQWEAATGKPIGEPLRQVDTVLSAVYSPDGTRIITACEDKTARQWEAATGKPIGEPLSHENPVHSAAYSPDGTRIVTASEDKTARQWEAATGKSIGEPLRHESDVYSAAYSPDGTRIVTACNDHTARQWEAATGKPIGERFHHENRVLSAAYSPDGTRIVTASWDNTARQWDAATGKSVSEPLSHENVVWSAAYSPDGTRIVTASEDKTARQWEAATGKSIGEPLRHESDVYSAAYSPDGTRIVTACNDHTARQWEAATGKPIGEPLHHKEKVNCAAYSPDGTRIVTASWDNTARQWDAATGMPIGEPLHHEEGVNCAAYSPDGTRIVTACYDDTARQWETVTGKSIGEPLSHENVVWSAAYSPDGTRIVTASGDKTARQWEAATGKPIGEPLHHENTVTSAAYSPDGTYIVTASWDKTARQWEAATGMPLGEPLRQEDAVRSAAYSPDGTRIATACDDYTARQWECSFLSSPSPIWFGDLIQVLSGLRFDENGELQKLSGEERIKLRTALLNVLHRSTPPPRTWEQLALWALSPLAERRYTPNSVSSITDIAKRELNSEQ